MPSLLQTARGHHPRLVRTLTTALALSLVLAFLGGVRTTTTLQSTHRPIVAFLRRPPGQRQCTQRRRHHRPPPHPRRARTPHRQAPVVPRPCRPRGDANGSLNGLKRQSPRQNDGHLPRPSRTSSSHHGPDRRSHRGPPRTRTPAFQQALSTSATSPPKPRLHLTPVTADINLTSGQLDPGRPSSRLGKADEILHLQTGRKSPTHARSRPRSAACHPHHGQQASASPCHRQPEST